MVIPKY